MWRSGCCALRLLLCDTLHRWTFGVAILIVLAIQIWMVYVKAKEANSPSASGLLVCAPVLRVRCKRAECGARHALCGGICLLLSWAQNYAKRARPRTVRAPIVTARVAFSGGQILTLITIVTGFVYPTVWVLGEEGLEAFDINVETGVTVMADLMSKVWALYCARPPRPLSLCLPPSSVRTSCSRGVNDASMRLAYGTAQG